MYGQDLRFAFRQLYKAPGFSLTVVLTFALGIGATTAIFSLVEGILLRPLPFENPERLVLLGDHLGSAPTLGVTAREIGIYSNATSAFSSLGGFAGASYEISGGEVPEQIHAARLTWGVFPTLGVQPVLGRVFTRSEEEAHQPLAVISYALWLERFHLDSHIIGSSITLDRKAYTIIGVMPRSFEFPLQPGHIGLAQVWLPMAFTADELSDREAGAWKYKIVARLKDGVTMEQAAQDADRVAKQVMRSFPATMSAIRIRGDITPLREFAVTGARPLLRTLLAAVAIVLLIACVNVAGMLLVRAIARRREYAVRLALGARSAVILRESALEGLLLSVTGGLLGLAIAAAVIRAAPHFLPDSMPRVDSISVDWVVVAFALLLAAATGALCSLVPAFAALRTNLIESLKEGAKNSTGAASHTWLRSTLVITEIAVALILLTISGAFLRSFQKMRAVDPGFRPDHVLVAGYRLPLDQYPTEASVDNFNQQVVDRLSSKPGTAAVGMTSFLPSSGLWGGSAYTVEGTSVAAWKLKFAMFSIVDGDFFKAMSMPLLDGRYFSEKDGPDAPLVIIVNQSMASHLWSGERAIGKRMHGGGPTKGLPWATVVGIVADTRLGSRDEPAADQWYIPAKQPAILFGRETSGKPTNSSGYITLRSALPPEEMTRTLRATVAEIDPVLALQEVEPMDDVISKVEAPRRFNTGLISAFALGALLLTLTGIYSVVAFSASLRSHEIAIRMALGAQRVGIARLVLISGTKLALLGCTLGVLGSIAVSGLVRSFLFDVSPTDPFLYGFCVVIMLMMALLASALPATRAASADPIKALRST